MALFFDQDWFNARLAERGLTRTVLAAAAGISEADLVLVWKDQRELSAREVAAIAELLGVTGAEAADRAGVSTPTPGADPLSRIADLERRVAFLESEVAKIRGGRR